MKNKIISILAIFLLIVNIINAQPPQQSYTLQSNESGATKNYVARDIITLKPGFQYTAGTGKTFNAKIEPRLLFPPTSGMYAKPDGTITSDPSQGGIVGTIPGQFSVTSTGAATYTIPIECPPGINGMEPKISLVYNSQAGHGSIGLGWNINGSSTISRTTKNLYFDNVRSKVVQFNSDDRLNIDGQHMILLSGDYFNINSIYATEIENYNRIKILNSIETNNIYFELTTKEGTVMQYGRTSNSTVKNLRNNQDGNILAWQLNEIRDIFGNYMTYTYEGNGQYLSQIQYTGRENNKGSKQISFVYETNTVNPMKFYIKNFLVKQDKVLSKIIISSDNTEIGRYQMNYDAKNKLKEVCQVGMDNVKYNPTTIKWHEENPTLTVYTFGDIADTNLVESPGAGLFFGDVNGDGYPDRVEFWCGDDNRKGYFKIYRFDNSTKKYFYAATEYFSFDSEFNNRIILGDINNDGKEEIVLFERYSLKIYEVNKSTNTLHNYQIINIKDNPYFFSGSLPSHRIEWRQSGNYYTSFLTNMNDDEYIDLVIIPNSLKNQSKPYLEFYYGGSNGFSRGEYVWQNLEGLFGGVGIIGDFNADGKLDAMPFIDKNMYSTTIADSEGVDIIISKEWFESMEFNFIRHHAFDIDNDGLCDILKQHRPGFEGKFRWSIYKNNGGYFTTPSKIDTDIYPAEDVIFSKPPSPERCVSYVLDFDGDGLLDLILGDENWSNQDIYVITRWYFYKNTGGSFQLIRQWFENDGRISKLNGVVADINNDGIDDLVFPCGNKFKAFSFSEAWRDNLVHTIKDGLGIEQSIIYGIYSDYSKSDNIPQIINTNKPMVVVKSHFNGKQNDNTEYEYIGAKTHTKGRGFLGFETITSKNKKKNRITVNQNIIDDLYYCVFQKSIIEKTFDNYSISEFDQKNDIIIVDAEKKRFIPVVKTQYHANDIVNISKNITIDYDNYGNITQHTTTTGNLVETINTTYKKRIISGIPYLPDTITNIARQDGTTHTRKTVQKYNLNGSLMKETLDPGDNNELVTEYQDYNAFGLPGKIEITANNKTRTSTVTYTSSGCFIKTKTDPLGETITYNWDETRGALKSQTNRIGTITYTYDGFGRLTETLYPDGKRNANVLRWASTNSLGAKYYLYSELSGTAPVYTWYNSIGQEVVQESYGLNDLKVSVFTEYQDDGNVKRVSAPTFGSTSSSWDVSYTYDVYGRAKTITTPMGTTTYNYAGRTTSITTPEGSQSTTINTAEQVVQSVVDGRSVTYTYYPSGLMKTATPNAGQAISMEYNLQGNCTRVNDPDAGIIRSRYNGFGELEWTKQKVYANSDSVSTYYTYTTQGLLSHKQVSGSLYTYINYLYDEYNRLESTSLNVGGSRDTKHKQSFIYDSFDRILSIKEEIEGRVYNTSVEYDIFGRISKEIYPSGYYLVNKYDKFSNLIGIWDGANNLIWQPLKENARRQLTHIKRGNMESRFSFDNRGFAGYIYTEGVIDLDYQFNTKGNLEKRYDYEISVEESFIYDSQNRLKNWDIYPFDGDNPILQKKLLYNSSTGNILSKSDVGTNFQYGENNNKPHALTSFTPVNNNVVPDEALSIGYTDFKKVEYITEGNKSYDLSYGVDNQRRKSVYSENRQNKLTRYYAGNYEEEINAQGNVRKIHYLSGAILIQNNGRDSLLYTHTDYLGSLTALSDVNGNVLERYAYDPWGMRRNPTNWAENDTRASFLLNRGYTGHEHIDQFGLINMNGRMYDPLTSQFLSPDPYLQAPENWLNYNRYSYALNNPFKYTDPSGELLWEVILGAAIYAGISYAKAVRDNGGKAPKWTFQVGYSSESGVFLGTSSDGNNFVNFGSGITDFGRTDALRVGSTQNGVTQMASPFYRPISPEQAVVNAENRLFRDSRELIYADADPNAIYLPYHVLNGHAIQPTTFTEPLFMFFTDAISNGLQFIGISERPAEITAGISILAGSLVLGRPKINLAKSGIANSRALGIAGEQAVGLFGPKKAIQVGGRTRIPDALTRTTLIEVKNVKSLSYMRQLKDFHTYAQQNGLEYILYTRPSTKLSGPLQRAIDNGLINLKFIPE